MQSGLQFRIIPSFSMKNIFSGLVRSVRLDLPLLHRPHNARECSPEEHWHKHIMCQRDLNWQTSLPPGEQNSQVQILWSQESNPKHLMSVLTIQKPCEAAPQVKFKTNNKVLTSWMCKRWKVFPFFLAYTSEKHALLPQHWLSCCIRIICSNCS